MSEIIKDLFETDKKNTLSDSTSNDNLQDTDALRIYFDEDVIASLSPEEQSCLREWHRIRTVGETKEDVENFRSTYGSFIDKSMEKSPDFRERLITITSKTNKSNFEYKKIRYK